MNRRSLAAFLILFFAACGSTQPTSNRPTVRPLPPPSDAPDPPAETRMERAPTPQERQNLARLVIRAERARELSFESNVEVAVQNRQAIVHHIFRELEEEDLEESRRLYVALGLLPPDMDVRALLEGVLGEQVVGYYDDEEERLVIRDDIMARLQNRSMGDAHLTIVHELVHGLQDQAFSLGDAIEDDALTDQQNAYQAVVEGDATLAMMGAMLPGGQGVGSLTAQPELLRRLIEAASSQNSDPALADAPAILRITLLSSYMDGLLFCARLHQSGGWAAVNEAHRSPPVSTEQVLHPERYLRGEQPDEITLPAFPGIESGGFAAVSEESLGELEMRVYFGQRTDSTDEAAADGWNGDRLRIYSPAPNASEPATTAGAIVWFSTWDSVEEAAEAEQAAERVQEGVPAGEQAGFVAHREGRALVILRNLPAAHHPEVLSAFRSFAQGIGPAPSQAAAP